MIHIPFKKFAEIVYEEGITNFSGYAPFKQLIKEDNEIYNEISHDEKRIEWEIFYLSNFLFTFTLQRKLIYLGNEKIKKILDAIHQQMYSMKRHPDLPIEGLVNISNMLAIRYNQYYRAIKEDWKLMEEGAKDIILFHSLVLAFIENLLNRKITFQEFGLFRLKFGLFIAEICKSNFDFFEEIKTKYEIKFEEDGNNDK